MNAGIAKVSAGTMLIVLFAGCSAEPAENPQVEAAKAKVLEQFKGPDEPTAKDAIWTSDKMFKVAVIDDGSNRNGFAQYVCGEIKAGGLTAGFSVEIIDITSVLNGDTWKELGSARC